MAFDLTAVVNHKRRVAQMLMPDDWVLERPNQNADDGQGGRTTVWETVASGTGAANTGARLLPAGYQAREEIMREQPTAIGAWTIFLPQGTAVQSRDRVVIGGRRFYVSGMGGPHAWDLYLQIAAAEVQ